jgi:exonuclease SbcD
MKFIHTSDLHIGKRLGTHSLLEDQRHIFDQLIELFKAENYDALLISGDIYDKASPSTEAVALLDDLISELAAINMPTIIISGNHDSPERLSFASRVLGRQHIHIAGDYNGKLERITLTDSHGAVNFYLLPYLRPSLVRHVLNMPVQSYTEAVDAVLTAENIDYSQRNVLLAHQYFSSAQYTPILSDSEERAIGGLDSVDVELVKHFDYVALGHLHKPQSVYYGHVIYSGSSLKYSLSEANNPKAIMSVELRAKGELTIDDLCLPALHDLRHIKAPIADILAQPINTDDYIYVTLTDIDFIPDAHDRIKAIYPNTVAIGYEQHASQGEVLLPSPESLSPLNIFADFFTKQNGKDMSNEQEAIVRELFGGRL